MPCNVYCLEKKAVNNFGIEINELEKKIPEEDEEDIPDDNSNNSPNKVNNIIDEQELEVNRQTKEKSTAIRQFLKYFFTGNFYLFCYFVYGIWTSVGVIFYSNMDNWTNATSYYFAMGVGLSVGFCKPAESSDNSKVFTIFYVLVGSIIVSGTTGIITISDSKLYFVLKLLICIKLRIILLLPLPYVT